MAADPARMQSVSERLHWLLDVAAVPTPAADGVGAEPRWRRYTDTEIAAAIHRELAIADLDTCAAGIDRVRRGESDDPALLRAIAEFFGVPGYFGDDPERMAVAERQLVERAMGDCDVQTYRLCRDRAPGAGPRREYLRRALDALRLGRSRDAERPSGRTDAPPSASAAGVDVRDTTPLRHAELRAMCIALLATLDIVPPLTPEHLCRRLGEHRGRRIRLVADEVYTTSSVGHLICKRQRDVIVYQRAAPRAQQMHVIYHEVVHLVRDHLAGDESLVCGLGLDDLTAPSSADNLYAHWQEWEAETGATILSQLSRTAADPELMARAAPPAESGIAAAFGLTRHGWR